MKTKKMPGGMKGMPKGEHMMPEMHKQMQAKIKPKAGSKK